MKKLSKDHIIDGQVYSGGTQYKIQEDIESIRNEATISKAIIDYISFSLFDLEKSSFDTGVTLSRLLYRLDEHSEGSSLYNHFEFIGGFSTFFGIQIYAPLDELNESHTTAKEMKELVDANAMLSESVLKYILVSSIAGLSNDTVGFIIGRILLRVEEYFGRDPQFNHHDFISGVKFFFDQTVLP